MSRPRLVTVLAAALAIAAGAVSSASAIDVLAFGDSITLGVGDPAGTGYPKRLKKKLEDGSTVTKHGVAGELTADGLSRLGNVLGLGGDVILLMEGTNDITKVQEGKLSLETTMANIKAMVSKSQAAGIEPVLSSIIPRSDRARRDRSNELTAGYVAELRRSAFEAGIRFADPFDLFDPELHPNFTADYYSAERDDRVGHLNEDGYERLAGAFADLLNGSDTAAPVVGSFEPGPLPVEVPAEIKIRVPVYDFNGISGLNRAETKLLINGNVVTDGLEAEGTEEGLELVHKGRKELGCRAVLHVMAQDNAEQPNTLNRTIAIYGIVGREVLPGDVDFDCRVDGVDLVRFALRFGADTSDPRYALPFDVNRDGIIDESDLEILSDNFAKSSL